MLGEIIRDSSVCGEHEQAIYAAGPTLVDEMNVWLRGQRSTRASLIEMAWRLELGECCVSAVTWLHDLALASGVWRIPR